MRLDLPGKIKVRFEDSTFSGAVSATTVTASSVAVTG